MSAHDDRLIFLIGQARQRLYTHLDRVLTDQAGVTTAQAGALFFLQQHDGCLLLALSRGLQLDKSAITRLAGRLEKKGLIERRPCRQDRRAVRVHLTLVGQQAASRCLAIVRERSTAIKADFWPSEIESFRRILKAVIQRFAEK